MSGSSGVAEERTAEVFGDAVRVAQLSAAAMTAGGPMTDPDGRTPTAPDNDHPDDGTHGGESQLAASGQTPHAEEPAEGRDDVTDEASSENVG